MDAVCVDPKHVKQIWPTVSHFIKAATVRGDIGLFGDIEDDVLNGDALLWLAYESPKVAAAAVTQIGRTETAKVCHIVACGGSRHRDWLCCLADIEAYAKSQGCRSVRLMGRPGWQRVLKNYSATRIILERRL